MTDDEGDFYRVEGGRKTHLLDRKYAIAARMEAAFNTHEEMLAALEAIIGICQGSLEDHFGDKIGRQIRKAVAKAKGGAA